MSDLMLRSSQQRSLRYRVRSEPISRPCFLTDSALFSFGVIGALEEAITLSRDYALQRQVLRHSRLCGEG